MEQQEKYNFNVNSKDGEVIIRHGEAMPVREPQSVEVQGQIDTVSEYLSKRDVDTKDSYLKANMNEGVLLLVENASSYYTNKIHGFIEPSREISEWKINSEHDWSTQDLATFMKKHIHHFYDKKEGRELVSSLMNFEGKVEKEIQDQNDQKGNVKYKYAQAVQHNLPGTFWLSIPIFRGQEKQKFEVEVIVDSKDYSCNLISNELYEMSDNFIEERIGKELEAIEKDYPSLPVIYV